MSLDQHEVPTYQRCFCYTNGVSYLDLVALPKFIIPMEENITLGRIWIVIL